VKFEVELEEGSYRVYSEAEYRQAEEEGRAVFEDPAEYLGHVWMFPAVKDGKTVWVGVG